MEQGGYTGSFLLVNDTQAVLLLFKFCTTDCTLKSILGMSINKCNTWERKIRSARFAAVNSRGG